MSFLRRNRIFFILAAAFIGGSGLIYYAHFRVFQNPYHILIYLLGDLAFLPLEVFIVVIVIERILAWRDKKTMIQKLNMVIGAFFSEVGNHLIASLICALEDREQITKCLAVRQNWSPGDFNKAKICAAEVRINIECSGIDMEKLRAFLIEKRGFLLRLLENPNLLEHEDFTDLMWAVFHLAEELEARTDIAHLPQSDLEHLAVDIQRVYGRLAVEWVRYLEHLRSKYPFLFSLVMRTHPFQAEPSPVVR